MLPASCSISIQTNRYVIATGIAPLQPWCIHRAVMVPKVMNPGAWDVDPTFIEKIVDDPVWLQDFQLYVSKTARFFGRFDRGNHFCRFLTFCSSLGYEQNCILHSQHENFCNTIYLSCQIKKYLFLFGTKYPRQRVASPSSNLTKGQQEFGRISKNHGYCCDKNRCQGGQKNRGNMMGHFP